MNKNFKGKIYLICGVVILATGFLFGPFIAKAATIIYLDLENPAISEGDIFMVKMKVSSPDKSVNVIDGTLLYDNNKLEIKEISAGGSLLSLWSKPPVFSNDKGTLNFVGGVPGGFQDEEGEVLKIIFLAKSEGEAQIDFLDGFSVFLNDGRGTKINPWLRPLSLNISKRPAEIMPRDDWQVLLESDKNPPESFEIIVGKDPSIFNNQYFISFFTTDKESGINYYEIQEGTEPYVIGDSPYLLKDQKLKSTIKVKAIDKAGNERIVEIPAILPPLPFYKTLVFWIIIVIVSVVIIIFSWIIINRIKKKKIESE